MNGGELAQPGSGPCWPAAGVPSSAQGLTWRSAGSLVSCHYRLVSTVLVDTGLAALRAGDTTTARRVLERAVTEVASGEALEGLAETLYLESEYPAAVAQYERAYAAYRRKQDRGAAGRAARMLAWITGNVLGDWAVRSGWLARARTLLAEEGESRPERGWVLIDQRVRGTGSAGT